MGEWLERAPCTDRLCGGLGGQQEEVHHHCYVVGLQMLQEWKNESCWSRDGANGHIPGFGLSFPEEGGPKVMLW